LEVYTECRLRGWEEDTPFIKVLVKMIKMKLKHKYFIVDGLLLLKKGRRRREFLDDFVLFSSLSFHLLFNFYCFYPKRQTTTKEEGKRREEEVSRG